MTVRIRRLRYRLPVGMTRANDVADSIFGTGYRRYDVPPKPLAPAHTATLLKALRESYATTLTAEQRAAWSARYA